MNGIYEKPGREWEASSQSSLNLLNLLARELRTKELLPLPMSFSTVMEFIGADQGNSEESFPFFDRAFFYLVGLILHQHRQVMMPIVFLSCCAVMQC